METTVANENYSEILGSLKDLLQAVCGETGFASAVRNASQTAYPWPALDLAEERARAAIAKAEGGAA